MKKTAQLLMLIIALNAFSCGDSSKKETAGTAAVNVTVAPITSSKDGSFLAASGTVETDQHADISTRMMGYVTNVHVKVGDHVSKGQLLVSINNTDIAAKEAQVKAGIIQAKAGLKNAEKDYNRFKTLFSQNSASQKELDDMTTRYEVAKAQLEATQQMQNEVNAHLSYSNIRAPFGGTITGKYINNGDMANPGMPLVSLEAPGQFLATVMIPETEISNIKKGTAVQVTVKSSGDQLSGIVSEVSNSARLTGGQYIVKINLNKTDAKLYSGMFVITHFPVTVAENTMVIVPKSVLVTRGELIGIYTVSQANTAILRWVRLGKTFGNDVEILSGLNQGETYIATADSKLYNGTKINIKK
ncbi:MAG: efflux RND transporter periplasmic adaptor subunit [Flavobacteriaceae bacterium]|nr:efflux RND transporter periplasmic adaptor subunit [Flavobacteriaceae bacterium]